MRYASEMGIQYTTFDTVCELQKLAKYHPTCQALLRLRTDDVTARCQLGNKYGANPADAADLLQVLQTHILACLMGASFTLHEVGTTFMGEGRPCSAVLLCAFYCIARMPVCELSLAVFVDDKTFS